MSCLAACDRSSPTDPSGSSGQLPADASRIVGNWTATTPIRPAGEDWASIVLSISNTGGVLEGQVLPRVGPARRLTVAIVGGTAVLTVDQLPQNESIPCTHIGFTVQSVELRNGRPETLIGQLSGRCPNTLNGAIRFSRA